MVRMTGLEPVRCYSLEPESSASANSATCASLILRRLQKDFYIPDSRCIPICIRRFGFMDPATVPSEIPAAPRATSGKRLVKISKDGKRRSFPKVPHLLQHVSSDSYYARTKVNGKSIRQSLETDENPKQEIQAVASKKFKRHGRGFGSSPRQNHVSSFGFSPNASWWRNPSVNLFQRRSYIN